LDIFEISPSFLNKIFISRGDMKNIEKKKKSHNISTPQRVQKDSNK